MSKQLKGKVKLHLAKKLGGVHCGSSIEGIRKTKDENEFWNDPMPCQLCIIRLNHYQDLRNNPYI